MSVKGSKRGESPHKSYDTTIEIDSIGSVRGLVFGRHSIEESHTTIFRLNMDCFEAIFDYLSLKDLHSFGQTCRAMQQMAGDYFQRNFKSAEKFSAKMAFTRFIQTMKVYRMNVLKRLLLINSSTTYHTITKKRNRFITFIRIVMNLPR